jgi:hypothetical protein
MHNRTCAKDKSCTEQGTLQESFQSNTLASSQEASEPENQPILSYVFVGPVLRSILREMLVFGTDYVIQR